MPSFMKRFSSETYAFLRMAAGFLILWHGAQKLFGFPIASPEAPPFIIFIAGPVELLGGLLLLLGLYTRCAAFVCSGLMAFAYWMAHGTSNLLPILNGGELAALYCFVFLYISANGAGKWSVDTARGSTS